MIEDSGEPLWLTSELVKAIHDRQLPLFGGPAGIRDEGALELALSRPINRWALRAGSGLPALAAAYAFGIARNHPFVDGNKRAALLALDDLFLGSTASISGGRGRSHR